MSDQAARPQIDFDRIVAEIERDLAEAGKLRRESEKFVAEQRKLIAEAQKLDRDRWLAPWLAVVGLVGGLVAIATLILRAVGHG